MNPPLVLPPQFDHLEHALNRLTTNSLPRNTIDTSTGAHFSRPFSVEEIDAVKTHIRSHNKASARGADGVSYDEVLQIPSERLCELFQAYRTIGLESCLLKTLTLLIDRRLRAWAEDVGRIPDSQNGFRAGHRTFNNAFILRAAIEKARALGKTLYVVFLDLANAFPSVDQSTLWAKLSRWGVAGPLID
ncbi:uncharacterized protein TRAVEDRAFT_119579, partial [Trametes versicolor FP-101664 SS1]|uniref:uncharacterized protein n=1 Tax=Trametes versicolor (strain FP-101664) TaxID=717944 RepID=UPI0004621ADE